MVGGIELLLEVVVVLLRVSGFSSEGAIVTRSQLTSLSSWVVENWRTKKMS